MAVKRYSTEQIVNKLCEVEVLISQGKSVAYASKQIGVTEQTYYRWRKEYGGLKSNQAKRLKELEKENAASSDYWLTLNSTKRFCAKQQPQTSEPAPETTSCYSSDGAA